MLHLAILLIILLAAGALRFTRLDRSPPGLNQDEAQNAWDAWCLVKTGKDMVGDRWPIFYAKCFGGNRSTLYNYYLMPFYAVTGMSIKVMRFASALAGLAAILLLYYVGSRMFDRWTGLVAAGLMTLNPWHIQQSRWGHEATLCPLLVVLPLAVMLWANLPLADARRPPRALVALLAGAVMGICCYGYQAVRLFWPAFGVVLVCLTWRAWWQCVKTRQGAVAVTCFLVGLGVTFGPLGWKHVTDAENMNKRARGNWVWAPDDPVGRKVKNLLTRYVGHFGLDFLFVRGDHLDVQSPPGVGQFHWYMLPMMACGLGVALYNFRSSGACRALLGWVLVYPVSDILQRHISIHALRSLPGLCGLILLGAVGATVMGRWLWGRSRPAAWAAACLMGAFMIILNVRFLHHFFGQYSREEWVYNAYNADLLEACDWLRPKLNDVDAVFFTTKGVLQPFLITVVGLRYDPGQWLADVKDVYRSRDGLDLDKPGPWDLYGRYGKIYFSYARGRTTEAALAALSQNGRRDRVVFIVRPGELRLKEKPICVIRGPEGKDALWIYEALL